MLCYNVFICFSVFRAGKEVVGISGRGAIIFINALSLINIYNE